MHKTEQGKIRQGNRGLGPEKAFSTILSAGVVLISNREPLKVPEQRSDVSRDVTEEDLETG